MFELMQSIVKRIYLTVLFATIFFSCKKDSFITASNALISFSADSLHFDTLFTTTGSVTQSIKIFNLNNQKLRIHKIELAGGAASSFKINVNGLSNTSFSDIDIAANDSIYIFVTVNVDPNQMNQPFLLRDSILIGFNANNEYIQLDAYGRNAHFLKNFVIKKDTSFSNDLPYVILGSLTVNSNATLIINKGAEFFCHQNAAIIVDGTLKINGEKAAGSQVTFKSDRLDDPYKYYPGSWQGIIFSNASVKNEINSAIIQNTITAITINGKNNSTPQLKINACIITNNLNDGVNATNSNIYAENCLITNCGLNNVSLNSGVYDFIFCTIASYSDVLLSHAAPVLAIADTISSTQTAFISVNFTNSIIYGEDGSFDDEINLFKAGSNYNVNFDHVLYKTKTLSEAIFANSINNINPDFADIDEYNAVFDFHLSPQSICKDAGKLSQIKTDMEGNPRTINAVPDIGCYETQ